MEKNKLIDFSLKPNSLNTKNNENTYTNLCKLIVQINYIWTIE